MKSGKKIGGKKMVAVHATVFFPNIFFS